MVTIRPFQARDVPAIAQLFHDTVHTVNAQDYSPAQLQAWAPDDLYFRDWETRCTVCLTYVAVEGEQILGFAELSPEGHIGCFYCHKDHQRRGIGRQLYQALLTQAEQLQLSTLTVEASITAKPFFEALGFRVLQEQQVQRHQQTLTNYRMVKGL
ncbi:GNAT family N-acetyltransferase [Synechococcus moorigangaii CMS01]|nr:GNAT family N-acetyltransferase [Synechococcus moorigangaii CMS01]